MQLTPLQKTILCNDCSRAPCLSDIRGALSNSFLDRANSRITARTAYSMYEKGLIDWDFRRQGGREYIDVWRTKLGEQTREAILANKKS